MTNLHSGRAADEQGRTLPTPAVLQDSAPVNRLEHRPDGTTRFLAQGGLMGGRWFSLHDVDQGAGRVQRLELGSSRATHRVFLQADRGRFYYEFAPGDNREITPTALDRQLQSARYFNPSRVARDGR